MASYVPNGRQQFFDANGVPLALGSVGMYVVGTLTPANTWQDSAQTTLNANPIPLDAGGFAMIYGSGQYRQIVKDELGNVVWDRVTEENSIGSFSPGNPAAIAGSKAKVVWNRNDATYPIENEAVIWPGAMAIGHGISSTFTAADGSSGNPCFGFFSLANNNGSNGEVVALGGSAVARGNSQTVFGGNVIARTASGVSGAKLFGLEIDVEPDPTATSLSTAGRGLAINAFNLALPFAAMEIGAASGGSFANGILCDGLASTAACLALGATGVADSIINSSTGTLTTAACVFGQGATRGIKWFTSGGVEAARSYFDGTNVRHVLPSGGGVNFLDNAETSFIANVTLNGFRVMVGSLGYGTGVGGAVTQATSRTTGVTLNKICGQITLVSAAGSTSWQTFTVTNSTIAATDVVRVNQASGTDKYQIHVTHVGAGSFDITFATTGGTTTEQPVFNFAIIKSVAA